MMASCPISLLPVYLFPSDVTYVYLRSQGPCIRKIKYDLMKIESG